MAQFSKTIYFDFDSTIVTKESLDEVIAYQLNQHGQQDPQQIEKLNARIDELTNLGMEGLIDFTASVNMRLECCQPTLAAFEAVGNALVQHITPGFAELFDQLRHDNWRIYIISGGFVPSLLPTASALGVPPEQVFANQALFDEQGNFINIDETTLLWSNEGKGPVIDFLQAQDEPQLAVLVGDGSNDLKAWQTGSIAHFIGFGANAVRTKVEQQAPHFAHSTDELISILADIEANAAST